MDAKAPRGPFGSSPLTVDKNPPPSLPRSAASSAPLLGQKFSSNSIKAWRPSPDLHGSEGLTIPYSGSQPMNRSLYETLLEQRLKELIEDDPEQAQQVLSSDPENLSDLYQIAMQGQPEEWPSQILMCGQMQTLLDRINWKKGTSLSLDRNELPSLDQITEALAQ